MPLSSPLKCTTLLLLPFIAGCVLSITPHSASAQAVYAATRQGGHLSVFGEGSRVNPDYGNSHLGYTFGIDYTRQYRILNPSIEFRITHASGDPVSETTYMGGLKGSRDYGRFHPYADLLIGYGKITFAHPSGNYLSDNSTVFDGGAGLDYDVYGPFAVKGEFQYQSWKLGSGNSRLTPSVISFGVVYHIPLGF